jgi:hypothetical protein
VVQNGYTYAEPGGLGLKLPTLQADLGTNAASWYYDYRHETTVPTTTVQLNGFRGKEKKEKQPRTALFLSALSLVAFQ